MRIGIIGTGVVGKTQAATLTNVGHDVMIGTRDIGKTLAKTDRDMGGNPPFAEWQKQHANVKLGTFADAGKHGEVIINATSGSGALEALTLAGAANLKGKIIMDISNPLDFSKGFPPSLTVCNTDSLGEQIQRSFPEAKVVKTLNTTNALLMANPRQLAGGDHSIFVSGNDVAAKETVTGYLREWFGWKDVIDMGDITSARGTEMLLPIWVRLYGVLKTPAFNFKIVR